MIVPVKCNESVWSLSILPNEITMADILLNLCGAYTDAGQKISTDFFLPEKIGEYCFLSIVDIYSSNPITNDRHVPGFSELE